MMAVQRWRRFLVALLLMGVMPTSAQTFVEQSVQGIAHVDYFAFGGVGYAGSTSKGELYFRRIMLESPDHALAVFEELYRTGNLQAKSYALVGIRALKPSRFKELYEGILTAKGDVATMQGCMVGSEHFGDIARQIDKGLYDPWLRAKPRA